jgi:hypothetical protein
MAASPQITTTRPQERVPALMAALAFAAGILLATRAWRPPAWWAVAVIVFLAAALAWYRRHGRLAVGAGLCAIAALGCLAGDARDGEYSNSSRAQEIAPYLDGTEGTITAHVVRDGVVRVLGSDRRQIVEVETEEIATADDAQGDEGARVAPVHAGIRLTIYSRGEGEDDEGTATSRHHQFVYGERLRFAAKLREPRNCRTCTPCGTRRAPR